MRHAWIMEKYVRRKNKKASKQAIVTHINMDIAVRVRLASGQTLKLRTATSSSYEQLIAQVRPPTNPNQLPLPPTAAHFPHCCANSAGGRGCRGRSTTAA